MGKQHRASGARRRAIKRAWGARCFVDREEEVGMKRGKEEESGGLTFDPDTGLYLRRAEVVQEQGASYEEARQVLEQKRRYFPDERRGMRGSPARKRTGQSPGLEKRRSPNGKSRSPEKRSSKSKDRVGAPLKPKETAVSGGLISASKRALEEAESVKDGADLMEAKFDTGPKAKSAALKADKLPRVGEESGDLRRGGKASAEVEEEQKRGVVTDLRVRLHKKKQEASQKRSDEKKLKEDTEEKKRQLELRRLLAEEEMRKRIAEEKRLEEQHRKDEERRIAQEKRKADCEVNIDQTLLRRKQAKYMDLSSAAGLAELLKLANEETLVEEGKFAVEESFTSEESSEDEEERHDKDISLSKEGEGAHEALLTEESRVVPGVQEDVEEEGGKPLKEMCLTFHAGAGVRPVPHEHMAEDESNQGVPIATCGMVARDTNKGGRGFESDELEGSERKRIRLENMEVEKIKEGVMAMKGDVSEEASRLEQLRTRRLQEEERRSQMKKKLEALKVAGASGEDGEGNGGT